VSPMYYHQKATSSVVGLKCLGSYAGSFNSKQEVVGSSTSVQPHDHEIHLVSSFSHCRRWMDEGAIGLRARKPFVLQVRAAAQLASRCATTHHSFMLMHVCRANTLSLRHG
jgi:hypothetical protein